jgi:hypothetical protein
MRGQFFGYLDLPGGFDAFRKHKENTERKHKTFGAEGGTLQECGLLGTVENATIPDDRSDMVRPPAPLRLQIG